MRLATWNVWNSPVRQRERLDAAVDVVQSLDADIVVLQEVSAGFPSDCLAARCGYPHVAWFAYPDEAGEGCAILSKRAFVAVESGLQSGRSSLRNCGVRCVVIDGDIEIGITNVHFDYRSIRYREAQVVDTLDWISSHHTPRRYEMLCGDFNCVPESSVYRYLTGQQSLLDSDTPPWHDVPRLVAERAGTTAGPTLDFWTNPRWHDAPPLDCPARVDWVMVRDGFDRGLPNPTALDAGRFGLEPAGPGTVVASDHYGVYVDIAYPELDVR
jgi:endonuclease/exonuclease/phosphatase family metal-dependent hydrolase